MLEAQVSHSIHLQYKDLRFEIIIIIIIYNKITEGN